MNSMRFVFSPLMIKRPGRKFHHLPLAYFVTKRRQEESLREVPPLLVVVFKQGCLQGDSEQHCHVSLTDGTIIQCTAHLTSPRR